MQLPGIVLSLAAIGGAVYVLSNEELMAKVSEATHIEGPIGPVTQMNTMGGPRPLRDKGQHGPEIAAPGVLTPAADTPTADQIWSSAPVVAAPTSLVPQAAKADCSLSSPDPDAAVVPVFVDESPVESGVWTLGRDRLIGAALAGLRDQKANPGQPLKIMRSGADLAAFQLGQVAVAVTDRARPIHLVLQSGAFTAWTVSVAPGVRLARVTVLGNGTTALALPSGVAPQVEVITETYALCGVSPARTPTADWTVLDEWAAINETEAPARLRAEARSYDGWFRKTFGTGSEGLTAAKAAFVLVGPQPAPDARLAVPEPAPLTVFAGGEEVYLADQYSSAANLKARVNALIEEALGGPLDLIAPVEARKGEKL